MSQIPLPNGLFTVGQFIDDIQIYLQPTPVTIVNKVWVFI